MLSYSFPNLLTFFWDTLDKREFLPIDEFLACWLIESLWCWITRHFSVKTDSHVSGCRIRSESGLWRTTICYLRLFFDLSLEMHRWQIIPQRMVKKFYNCKNKANEYKYEANTPIKTNLTAA